MRWVASVVMACSAAACATGSPAPLPAECYWLTYADSVLNQNQPRLIGFYAGRDSVTGWLPYDPGPSPSRGWLLRPGRGDSVNVILADGPVGWVLTLAVRPDSASGEGHPIMDVAPPWPVPRFPVSGPRVSCSAFADR